MDIEFNNAKELYERLTPALKSKVADLTRDGYRYIKEEDVWNYLKDKIWINSSNLGIADMVSDIFSSDNALIDDYFKEQLNIKNRNVYFDN